MFAAVGIAVLLILTGVLARGWYLVAAILTAAALALCAGSLNAASGARCAPWPPAVVSGVVAVIGVALAARPWWGAAVVAVLVAAVSAAPYTSNAISALTDTGRGLVGDSPGRRTTQRCAVSTGWYEGTDARLSADVDNLERRVSSVGGDINSLVDDLHRTQRDVRELTENAEDLDEQTRGLTDELAEHDDRIDELEGALRRVRTSVEWIERHIRASGAVEVVDLDGDAR